MNLRSGFRFSQVSSVRKGSPLCPCLPLPSRPPPSASRPPRIRALADVAFGMEDVLFLQFGESTLPTPPYVIEAVNRAAQEGWTFYTANQGLPSLRAAIANQIAKLHAVEIDPSEIQVTSGGVQALNLAIKCVIDPGDDALVLSPNWPNGSAMVEMFGGRAVEVPMARAGQRFTPDRDALEAALTPRTRLLLYASPSNPLGWTADGRGTEGAAGFCPSTRAVAAGRRGLRAHLLRRSRRISARAGSVRPCGAVGAFDPAAVHAGGCRNRRQPRFPRPIE